MGIADLVPYDSPLIDLVARRASRAPVSEYRVAIGTPRTGGERLVDIYVAPVTEGRRIRSSSCCMSAPSRRSSTAS
jgi:hypothetical protein